MPIIPVTQVAQIKRIAVQDRPGVDLHTVLQPHNRVLLSHEKDSGTHCLMVGLVDTMLSEGCWT
jgi:hypothetical protein